MNLFINTNLKSFLVKKKSYEASQIQIKDQIETPIEKRYSNLFLEKDRIRQIEFGLVPSPFAKLLKTNDDTPSSPKSNGGRSPKKKTPKKRNTKKPHSLILFVPFVRNLMT